MVLFLAHFIKILTTCNNSRHFIIKYHFPKVISSASHWSLSYNESLVFAITLQYFQQSENAISILFIITYMNRSSMNVVWIDIFEVYSPLFNYNIDML